MGLITNVRALFSRMTAARRKNTPERDTVPYARMLQLGMMYNQKVIVKPTPPNIRYFSRTPYARQAIKCVKDPLLSLQFKIAPKKGVQENRYLMKQCAIAHACFLNPNNDDDWRSFFGQIIEDWLIFGAMTFEQQPSNDAVRPLWMWPVDAQSIQIYPAWSGDKNEARYVQTLGYTNVGWLQGRQLRNDELSYIRANASTETPYGYGSLEIAFQTINRQLCVADFAGNLASNAQPSQLLYFPEADDAKIREFREYWMNEVEGQGITPMWGGRDSPKAIDLHPGGDSALYLEYQQFVIREIATAFGISPMNMGLEADVNRNCYSEDTETLTIDGWKNLDQLSVDSLVATYNPISCAIEFRKPEFLHIANYDGDMVHVSGRMIDVLVTPDHRMWARRLLKNDGSKDENSSQFEIITASELKSGRFAVANCFKPDQSLEFYNDVFILPGCELGGGILKRYEDRIIPMDDWLSFLGFHISEGHAGNHGNTWKVNLCQKDGTSVCHEMNALIKRLSFAFDERVSKTDNVKRWQVADKALCQWLLDNCGKGSHFKRIPKFVFNLPIEKMEIIYESMMKGDGTTDKRRINSKSRTYYTASKKLADDMQLLSTYLGHRANISKIIAGVYRVNITEKRAESEIKGSRNVKVIPYSGRVYCFSVPPHHLFITRRNGKIGIHGNTAEVSKERDWDNAVVPLAELISAYLTRNILHKMLGYYQLEFTFEALYREDEENLANIYQTEYKNNAITPNEYREERGRPRMENEWGDRTFADFQIAMAAARGTQIIADPDLPGGEGKQTDSPQQTNNDDKEQAGLENT
jgi:hypothetical protein